MRRSLKIKNVPDVHKKLAEAYRLKNLAARAKTEEEEEEAEFLTRKLRSK